MRAEGRHRSWWWSALTALWRQAAPCPSHSRLVAQRPRARHVRGGVRTALAGWLAAVAHVVEAGNCLSLPAAHHTLRAQPIAKWRASHGMAQLLRSPGCSWRTVCQWCCKTAHTSTQCLGRFLIKLLAVVSRRHSCCPTDTVAAPHAEEPAWDESSAS